MKYMLVLILLCGCATIGKVNLEKKEITLRGYGAESFSYEKDGEKYSITRGKAIPIPDIIPTR